MRCAERQGGPYHAQRSRSCRGERAPTFQRCALHVATRGNTDAAGGLASRHARQCYTASCTAAVNASAAAAAAVVCTPLQLEELGRVVCGICLFNSAAPASDHGGTCSMAVPAALDATMCTPVHSAQQLLARVRHSAAEAAHSMDMCNNTLPFDSCSSSSDDGHAGVCTSNHVGRALFACQAALLLRQLGDDVAAVLDLCVKLQTGVHEMLGKAAALVASCGAHGVPKDDVLPLFEAAGRFHLALSGVCVHTCCKSAACLLCTRTCTACLCLLCLPCCPLSP